MSTVVLLAKREKNNAYLTQTLTQNRKDETSQLVLQDSHNFDTCPSPFRLLKENNRLGTL